MSGFSDPAIQCRASLHGIDTVTFLKLLPASKEIKNKNKNNFRCNLPYYFFF